MFSDDTTKEEILVTFLALLELIRRHSAAVEQDDAFGEIVISAGENLDNLSLIHILRRSLSHI